MRFVIVFALFFFSMFEYAYADTASDANSNPENIANDLPSLTATANYSRVRGNSPQTTFIGDLKGKAGIGRNIFQVDIYGQFVTDSSDSGNDANLWWISPQYDFRFIPELATNIQGMWKSDRYNGYWYEAYVGPGATYIPFNSKSFFLSLQFNIFYEEDNVILDSEYINQTAYGGESIRRYMAHAPSFELTWKFYDKMQFKQNFQYRADIFYAQNYFITAKSQLLLAVNSLFAFNITYLLMYNNLAPAPRSRSDDTLSAGLTFTY